MPVAAWVVIGVVVVLAIVLWSLYNGLVRLRNQVKNAWAQIDVQLKRRHDLIPNLVETVKGFATQERTIFEAVANARAKLAGAGSIEGQIKANNELSGALGRLLVIVENYPQLKSDANFRALMDELAGTENRISVERKRYNDAVGAYNVAVRRFPGVLFASAFGFREAPFYEVPESARQTPQVKF